ncbi:LysR family transcriptional regulator [Amaricoccus solimangrovi]|uniref:LysR family transcriptional regulator n=1 Tax=Amaricoccus solimangrovi TaxID=2589815 RepID=A0A501WID4_9RHOB|nr:LysR family transcriptional regulator [Amaricoccus solimangrovi]TPE49269.1 LysR family transcriptional regulator [Amaricoccus solimangrovi]
MDEIEDLRSFVEIARSRSLSRAAEAMGISKSMVSRRLTRLEAGFGARLFDRTTRGVRPTEAGDELITRAERILAELEEAREVVAARSGTVLGTLRLAAPLAYGVHALTPLLGELAAANPGLEIEVDFDDRFVDLIESRFDAVIRIGTLPDSSFIARRLAPVRAHCVASPDYLARRGRPAHPRDLAGHDCLRYLTRGGSEWEFVSAGRRVGFRPRGRLASTSGDAILRWAIAGYGIALLPSFMGGDAIAGKRLERVLPDFPSPESALWIMRPPGGYVPAKVRVLTDFLVARLGGG